MDGPKQYYNQSSTRPAPEVAPYEAQRTLDEQHQGSDADTKAHFPFG